MTVEEGQMAIFHLDKSKILVSDIFLCVLDGRVPDEGACVELGIAYCQKDLQRSNKLLIGLQTDRRAAFPGSQLNAMLGGALEYWATDVSGLLAAPKRCRDDGNLGQWGLLWGC